jgi:hypothetical protein
MTEVGMVRGRPVFARVQAWWAPSVEFYPKNNRGGRMVVCAIARAAKSREESRPQKPAIASSGCKKGQGGFSRIWDLNAQTGVASGGRRYAIVMLPTHVKI